MDLSDWSEEDSSVVDVFLIIAFRLSELRSSNYL